MIEIFKYWKQILKISIGLVGPLNRQHNILLFLRCKCGVVHRRVHSIEVHMVRNHPGGNVPRDSNQFPTRTCGNRSWRNLFLMASVDQIDCHTRTVPVRKFRVGLGMWLGPYFGWVRICNVWTLRCMSRHIPFVHILHNPCMLCRLNQVHRLVFPNLGRSRVCLPRSSSCNRKPSIFVRQSPAYKTGQ